ncbi:membrane bound O-acyl transferase family-domain-containing protein [Aspergillus nidulans var. acristatus]
MAPPCLLSAIAKSILIHLIEGGIIGFSPRGSILRPLALALIVLLAASIHCTIVPWEQHRSWAAMLSTNSLFVAAHGPDLFFHSGVTYNEHYDWLCKTKGYHPPFTLLQRARWACAMSRNGRRVGTKWQIVPIHPFDPDRPDYIPTRTTFLVHRLLTIFLWWIALYFLGGPPFHFAFPSYITKERQELLLDEYNLALSAFLPRFWLSMSFILGLSTLQRVNYNLFSVIAVSLRLSDPEDWPPMKGPFLGTWSVRRFWGHTWHQMFRRAFSPNADFITFSVLRLPRGTIFARYSRFFLNFLFSGVLHLFYDEAVGVPRDKGGAMLFYTLQPVAFAIEDFAQWMSTRYDILTEDLVLRALIGYTWVCIWCTLTWPIWVFPLMREPAEGQRLVHFLQLPLAY